MRVLDEVYNSVKGAKVYLILPYGSAEAIEVEERWIKELRRPKKKKKA